MKADKRNHQSLERAIRVVLDDVMLPYQREDIVSPDQFRWNCWSRQVGKSFSKSFRRLMRGIARKRDQFFLSAGERQSAELMLKVRQHVESLKLASEFEEAGEGFFEGVEIKRLSVYIPSHGIRVVGLPANPNTARGFTGDVFLDEFGMHMHDREIWGAMFPSILRGHGELDVASTPRGCGNKFYELLSNEQFGKQTITIEDAVAQGLKDVDISTLREAMGDDLLYRQEFMCEFLDKASALLTFEDILACMDHKLPRELDIKQLRERTDGEFYLGVDLGRRRDLTVIWVFERVGKMLISVGLLEIFNMPMSEQEEIIASVLMCPRVRRACIDMSGLGLTTAENIVRRFGEDRAEGVVFTRSSKAEMGGMIRTKCEDRSMRIPHCDRIKNDLHSVERSVTKTGEIQLYAPRSDDGHADRFWAAALAIRAASQPGGPIDVAIPEEPGGSPFNSGSFGGGRMW